MRRLWTFFCGDSQLVRDDCKAPSQAKCWMKEAALCSVGWVGAGNRAISLFYCCCLTQPDVRPWGPGDCTLGHEASSSYPHPHKTALTPCVQRSSPLPAPGGSGQILERVWGVRSVPVGKLVTCYHYCGVSPVTWHHICHERLRTLRCPGNGNVSETARNTRLWDGKPVLMERWQTS